MNLISTSYKQRPHTSPVFSALRSNDITVKSAWMLDNQGGNEKLVAGVRDKREV